ncbi:hypothetical protein AMEJIAPC_01865 [Caulobacter sp. NIBR1757]|nr:hypothetical protein AMEJIAPC_01865 [Caulobacter sp. NIBR1757]
MGRNRLAFGVAPRTKPVVQTPGAWRTGGSSGSLRDRRMTGLGVSLASQAFIRLSSFGWAEPNPEDPPLGRNRLAFGVAPRTKQVVQTPGAWRTGGSSGSLRDRRMTGFGLSLAGQAFISMSSFGWAEPNPEDPPLGRNRLAFGVAPRTKQVVQTPGAWRTGGSSGSLRDRRMTGLGVSLASQAFIRFPPVILRLGGAQSGGPTVGAEPAGVRGGPADEAGCPDARRVADGWVLRIAARPKDDRVWGAAGESGLHSLSPCHPSVGRSPIRRTHRWGGTGWRSGWPRGRSRLSRRQARGGRVGPPDRCATEG